MEESVMAPTTLRMNKSTGQSLWVEKHSPNSYNNLLTDEYLNRTVLQWVKEWDELVFKKKVLPRLYLATCRWQTREELPHVSRQTLSQSTS
jgi:hypothetical protein